MGFSSMYTGVTGLKSYSTGMQVIGNNLANVNTTGYKRSEIRYADLMSVHAGTPGIKDDAGVLSVSQKGKGVSVAAILPNFEQASFETTTTVTDLAIGGRGFFGVRDSANSVMRYTRNGVFRFNNEAYLVDPHGLRLQGYAVDRDTGSVAASATDILLPYEDVTNPDGSVSRAVVSPPRATTAVDMVANLDPLQGDRFTNASHPFFAMFDAWQGGSSGAGTFVSGNSSSLDVFDADGTKHTVTIHYDLVTPSTLSNASGGASYWEYIVTIDPAEDGRSGFAGTSAAGLLAAGTMMFDTVGSISGLSMYTLGTGGASKVLSNWSLTTFGSGGVPQLDVTFAGSGASATGQTISFDFGISSPSSTWTVTGSNAGANAIGSNAGAVPNLSGWERAGMHMTSYSTQGNATIFSSQDGYAEGYLQALSVDRDGFLTGRFTNGEEERLYQINLYLFTNEFGLRREGNNVFSATNDSGAAIIGTARSEGRGEISQSSLEMSNVDMAKEFADMILTQRAFQANTKVITTSDSLMNTALQIKR
ncbi:flagellar hook protein FlgE [Salidesulfovibrio onnuriiensis]|uniref:flagellar hook protein FlgE n=1 Tax=Salidesulfovibrio onnuriiensis TaxID=2583823 RepID=UPI0011C79861|nr:flagellar hook-basal body complex protein [Salidesulfovibrio onnuriiensis]